MSLGLSAVQWNRRKIIYDLVLAAAVLAYLFAFSAVSLAQKPPATPDDWTDLRLKALGSCAFLMLSLILCIGPLARLSPSFLPLLYNRRHFGVAMACVAGLHAWSMFAWYIERNALPSLLAELSDPAAYAAFIGFPFKLPGMLALAILFTMAATSHDHWQHFLSPRSWKALHMAVYPAYGLVVMHIALGALQSRGIFMPALTVASLGIVGTLHLLTGWREWAADQPTLATNGWVPLFPPADIADQAARIVSAGGERIAIFRDGTTIAAVTNLCAHQQGPLGEGRVIDGCITCPWHGYQYRMSDGCAPPPFTEQLATYRLRLRDGMLELDPRPLPPGTPAALSLPAP